jgi:hypothetical protein
MILETNDAKTKRKKAAANALAGNVQKQAHHTKDSSELKNAK